MVLIKMKSSLSKIGLGLFIPVVIIILFLTSASFVLEVLPYLLLVGWINLIFVLSLVLIHANIDIKKSTRLIVISAMFVVSIMVALVLLLQGVIDITMNAIMTSALGISALLNGQYMRKQLQLD